MQNKPPMPMNDKQLREATNNGFSLVREFRFTIGSADEKLEKGMFQTCSVNYIDKTICLSYMECRPAPHMGLAFEEWISQTPLDNRTLVLTTYDGSGNSIYTVYFTKVKLQSLSSKFDYSKSDVALMRGYAKFDSYEKVYTTVENTINLSKYQPTWTLSSAFDDTKLVVRPKGLPTLQIKEVEVNHLHDKMFVPGPAKWNPLELTIDEDAKSQLLSVISLGKVVLSLSEPVEKFYMEVELEEIQKAKDADRYDVKLNLINVRREQ